MHLWRMSGVAGTGGVGGGNEASSTSSNGDAAAAIVRRGRFWLAIAALSLIRDAQWLQLSSMWSSVQATAERLPEPLCENHDDGRTLARVFCVACQFTLCRECFTILHLHAKNRNHEVQIVGSAIGTPQLEIHEGCTRFRAANLLVLFHGSTLNGMVEFSANDGRDLFHSNSQLPGASNCQRSSSQTALGRCRFCQSQLSDEKQHRDNVCEHVECRQLSALACYRILKCMHRCGGIAEEEQCMPCLHCPQTGSRQDADDLCVICFTDRLGAAPCVQLDCGHIFHFICVRTVIEKRWNGPRITFGFMQCPLCKQQIEHPALQELIKPLNALFEEVAAKSRLRLEYDGLINSPAIKSENSEFFNDPQAFAIDRYVYVLCYKCGKAYFGGESRCQQALESSQYNPAELICGGCSDVTGAQVCGRHGVDYLEYKCRFCCSVAVYFCFGTTHFCAGCHDDFQRLVNLPRALLPRCPAGPKAVQLEGDVCPLRVQHPATGEEFALGCGICRNISTF